jgi:O-antigen ligase
MATLPPPTGSGELPTDEPATDPRLERAALGALALWATGVQWNEALASAGLGLAVLVAVLATRVPSPWKLLPHWGAVLAFVGWCSLAPLLTGHPPTGSGQARILDWIALPAASVCLALLGRRSRTLLVVLAASALLLSVLLAFLQHFGWWPPASAFRFLAWTRLPFERVYEPAPGAPGQFMAGGLLFHRLKFAHVSGFVVVWLLALAANRRSRALWFSGAVGVAAILWLPHARAAAVAVLLAVLCTLWVVLRGRPRRWLIRGLFFGAAIALLLPPVRDQVSSFATERSDGSRAFLLRSGLHAVQAHPWTGIGLGHFRPGLYPEPGMPIEIQEHRGKSHNQFLTLAAEAGVPAAFLFLVMLVVAFHSARGPSPEAAAARGSVVLLGALSVLHDPLFQAVVSMAAVLAIGLGLPSPGWTKPAAQTKAKANETLG